MSYPADVVVKGNSVARIIPTTLTGGKIATFGAAINLPFLTDETPEHANAFEKAEYLTKRSTQGVDLRIAKQSKTLDATTGAEVGAGSNADSIKITGPVGWDDAKLLIGLIRANTPVAIIIGGGIDAGGNQLGWEHLLGRISGNISLPRKEEINEITLTISGGEGFAFDTGVDETDYNTVATAAITPLGGSALTPVGLVTGDLTDFKAGKIIQKDAA